MMTNKIVIANSNFADRGKSTSIWYAFEILSNKYPNNIKITRPENGVYIPNHDVAAIIEIPQKDGHIVKVGIESFGDPGWERPEKTLKEFIKADCEIILVACHTKKGTIEHVTNLRTNHGFQVIWFGNSSMRVDGKNSAIKKSDKHMQQQLSCDYGNYVAALIEKLVQTGGILPQGALINKTNYNMSGLRLERTIWPVGHGAFYTEQFLSGNDVRFTVAYDCGAKTKALVQEHIDSITQGKKRPIDVLYISHLHIDHINGLYYLLHTNISRSRQRLIKKIVLPQMSSETILEALVYNFITTATDANRREEYEHTQNVLISLFEGEFADYVVQVDAEADTHDVTIAIDEQATPNVNIPSKIADKANICLSVNNQPIWRYKPVYYLPGKKCEELKTAINELLGGALIKADGTLDFNALLRYLHNLPESKSGTPDCSDLKKIYTKIFKPKGTGEQLHNNYSMPLYSAPIVDCVYEDLRAQYGLQEGLLASDAMVLKNTNCIIQESHTTHCLYTGDFEANDNNKLDNLLKSLDVLWDKVGLLQIPHHVSDNNHNDMLYSHKMLCFGNTDDKGDDSFSISTYRKIEKLVDCAPVIISEKTDWMKKEYLL